MAKLDYQEHYQRLAHASSINAIALSPNGRRFVTASEDSTVIVWSTGSADQLYHIKAHSPIHSLAWLTNSHGFIFGCRNGLLASVDMLEHRIKTTYFKAHTATVSHISPQFNDRFPITASMDEVKIWRRMTDQHQHEQVEYWKLTFMLPPPGVVDLCRKVEVSSVNWVSQLAGANASVALVSYKWHGIMCWDVTKATVLWRLPMEECNALSLSPDGRFVATFGFAKSFEVRELESGTVRSLQLQEPVKRPKRLVETPSVCFAHEGFAVAGTAAGESKVHVWDTGRGDQMLSLDHGDGFKIHTLATKFLKEEDRFLIITAGERQGKFYIFVWATVQKTIAALKPSAYERHRIELSFTRNFWINITFTVALVALFSRWVMYHVTSAAVN